MKHYLKLKLNVSSANSSNEEPKKNQKPRQTSNCFEIETLDSGLWLKCTGK